MRSHGVRVFLLFGEGGEGMKECEAMGIASFSFFLLGDEGILQNDAEYLGAVDPPAKS